MMTFTQASTWNRILSNEQDLKVCTRCRACFWGFDFRMICTNCLATLYR